MNEVMKQDNKIFVALVGASATGKSTVERILQDVHGMKRAISCTTRPKRHYEQDGVDYYFVTNEEVEEMSQEGLLVERTLFNNWSYCLTGAEFEDSDVVVIEPNGLRQIIENVGRENVFVVYLTYPDKERLIRSLVTRDDDNVEEVIRRFKADQQDMKGMEQVADVVINNHDSNKTANLINAMVQVLK